MIICKSTFLKAWQKKIYCLLSILVSIIFLTPAQAEALPLDEYVSQNSITFIEASPMVVSVGKVKLNIKAVQLFRDQITPQKVEVFLISSGKNLGKVAEFNISDFKHKSKTYAEELSAKKTVNLQLGQGKYQLKTSASEDRVDFEFEVVPVQEPIYFSLRLSGKIIQEKIPAGDLFPESYTSYVSNEIRVRFEENISYNQERDLLSKITEQINGKIIGREDFDYQIQIPDTTDGSGVNAAIELIKSNNLAKWAAPRYASAQYGNFCTLLTLDRKFTHQPGLEELFPVLIGISAISFFIAAILLIVLGKKIRRSTQEKQGRFAELLFVIYIIVACIISLAVPIAVLNLARSSHCYELTSL